MRTTHASFYDLYWTTRGIDEFEKMFGRKPFTSTHFDFDAVKTEKALQLLRKEMRKTCVHFGEGRLNPSTIASILALIEEKLTGYLPTKSSSASGTRTFLETVGMIKTKKENKHSLPRASYQRAPAP